MRQSEIEKLKEICSHPNLEVKHESDTGNYDPTQDCYYTIYNCKVCGKHWVDEKKKE